MLKDPQAMGRVKIFPSIVFPTHQLIALARCHVCNMHKKTQGGYKLLPKSLDQYYFLWGGGIKNECGLETETK